MAQREMEDTRFIKMIVDIEKNSEANWQGCHRFHSKNLKRSVPESFYENSKNSRTIQVGKPFLTQKFSNRTICFAVLVFTQIHNNLRSLFSKQFDNFHRKN